MDGFLFLSKVSISNIIQMNLLCQLCAGCCVENICQVRAFNLNLTAVMHFNAYVTDIHTQVHEGMLPWTKHYKLICSF